MLRSNIARSFVEFHGVKLYETPRLLYGYFTAMVLRDAGAFGFFTDINVSSLFLGVKLSLVIDSYYSSTCPQC